MIAIGLSFVAFALFGWALSDQITNERKFKRK